MYVKTMLCLSIFVAGKVSKLKLMFKGKYFKYISNEHKNGANASFSVQSKIFPNLKAQILQMRYQNIQEGSGFILERKKNLKFSIYHHFLSV